MVEERTKRSGEAEKEQGQSLSREVEVRKKRDRRGRIASVASIVCFFVPILGVLLWCIILIYLYSISDVAAEGGCSAGLGFIIGILFGITYGILVAVFTSTIGTCLGLYAVLSTKWQRGKAGLILNLLQVLVCGACILLFFTQFQGDFASILHYKI